MFVRQWRGEVAYQIMIRTGQPDPILSMQALTAELLDEAGQVGPRIDLDVVGSFQNIVSIVQCEMASAGRLVPTARGFLRVEVNKDHLSPKQRFTVAHEISHTLLSSYHNNRVDQIIEDAETGTFPEGDSDSREEEFLCDIGAAALLMDARFLQEYLKRFPLSIELLQKVVRDFDVSLHAATRRIAELAEVPIAFVIWERDHYADSFTVVNFYRSRMYSAEMTFVRGSVCTEESPIDWVGDSRNKQPIKQDWTFTFKSGGRPFRLYTESIYAPYLGKSRVISFVRPSRYQHRPTNLSI